MAKGMDKKKDTKGKPKKSIKDKYWWYPHLGYR